MALGYGYIQRDPEDQQLNWAQIGKDVSDRLEGEITRREEKKEQLDNLTSDLVKELNTSQFLTENSNFNKFVLDSSDTIKNQTLLANKLLKSGQLKPREFTLMMQNIVDGTDQTFGLFQDYKDEYEKKMAMMDEGLPVSQQGSNIMYGILENVEGFSNFQNHQLVLNPDSGVMSIGKVIDGKVSTNPNDLTSVEQLKNRIRTTINKFDLYGSADSYVESLGQTTEEIIKVGNKYRATEIQRITGATGSTLFDLTEDQINKGVKDGLIDKSDVKALIEFNKGIDTYVESELGIDGTFSSASLLADYFPGYTTTFDEAEAKNDSKKILLRSVRGRVIADLSEEQKDLAKDTLKTTIRNGLSKKTQTQFQKTTYNPSENMSYSDRVNAAKQKSLEEEVALVGTIYLGDNDTIKEAENYFKTRYPKFIGMNRTNNGLVVRIEGKEPVSYNFKDFKNAEEFTKSISALIMKADRATVGGITSRSQNYQITAPSQLQEDVGYGSVLSDAEARNQFGNVIEERANKVDKYQIGGVAVDKPKISFLEADYNTDDDDVRNLLIQNIKEAYPELELDVNIEQFTMSADQLTVSSDLINEPLKINIEQSGQENANTSMTQFLNWIKSAYEGGNLIRKVAGSSSQPAMEVEAEVEVEPEVEAEPKYNVVRFATDSLKKKP